MKMPSPRQIAAWAAALGFAGTALAQQQPRQDPAPGETELVFEREVFEYPSFERRNPFQPLLATTEGPRFEQMRLRGIVVSDDPSRSVAVIGTNPAGPAQRLRPGETWGNVRVLEVRRTEVLVEVEEFGLTEQHVMTLPSRAQGGS